MSSMKPAEWDMLICSSAMMLPLAMVVDAPWSVTPSLAGSAAVLGIAIISTAAAYLLFYRILATAGASTLKICEVISARTLSNGLVFQLLH